jgi:CPA1 family monovalent cation:H+ antiporter
MDLLERRLRLKALRAQRLELYSLSRHHQIGDDVLREVLGELDLSEAKLGQVK